MPHNMESDYNFDTHCNVNCDGCGSTNLVHYRYKCLICEDFDLCAACYENKVVSGDHIEGHPFQCLLDRKAREIFFAGDDIPMLCADSFTCPFCGDLGHSQKELVEHIHSLHKNEKTIAICPICVSIPGAHPIRCQNIAGHMTNVHLTD